MALVSLGSLSDLDDCMRAGFSEVSRSSAGEGRSVDSIQVRGNERPSVETAPGDASGRDSGSPAAPAGRCCLALQCTPVRMLAQGGYGSPGRQAAAARAAGMPSVQRGLTTALEAALSLTKAWSVARCAVGMVALRSQVRRLSSGAAAVPAVLSLLCCRAQQRRHVRLGALQRYGGGEASGDGSCSRAAKRPRNTVLEKVGLSRRGHLHFHGSSAPPCRLKRRSPGA